MGRKLPAVIISDPNVMGGEPVIRGTRVPARLIAKLVELGASELEILEDYPSVDLEGIRVALEWVREHPKAA